MLGRFNLDAVEFTQKDVFIAGFDGFKKSKDNFFDTRYEREVRADDYDVLSRISILKSSYTSLNIHFMTPSVYETAIF